MRTYGRLYQRDAGGKIIPGTRGVWVKVETAPDGSNDNVYLTSLAQVLQGNLNESPFYANWGLPQRPAVINQIFPDFFVWKTQSQFASFFASIIISRENSPVPTYKVNVTTNRGERLQTEVAV